MRIIHADWVILGDIAPLADGAIVVDDSGAIAHVGEARDVLVRFGSSSIQRIDGLVMPGLVNAHTHLELSALRGRVPGRDGFVRWVEHLIGARVELSPDEEESAIRDATAELRATCTVAVGEVTNGLGAVGALAEAKIAGCIFHEVFG